MLKRRTIGAVLTVLAAMLAPASAHAVDHPFGLGLELGVPLGLTGKGFITPEHAIAFALGYDFVDQTFGVTTDYLYHFRDVLPSNDVATLRPYVGGGVFLGYHPDADENDEVYGDAGNDRHGRRHPNSGASDYDNDRDDYAFRLALRSTAGISVMFRKAPVELFLDLSPGIWLSPPVYFYFAGVVGARFYF